MNHIASTLLVAALLSGPALAQQKADDHSAHHAATPATAAANSADMADGEVRKIDKDAGKLTLKHGEIKNLDMPGMTMVFQVKDKAWLDKLQPGDKVRFSAVNDAGRYMVTAIEVQR